MIMIFLHLYKKLSPLKKLCKGIFSYIRVCKFHCSVFKSVENKLLQSLSYDDYRLQNYLKMLKDEYLTTHLSEKTIYDHNTLRNIVSLVNDIENLNSEYKEFESFISELKGKDSEMLTTAQKEKEDIEKKLSSMKSAVLLSLIPDDYIDNKDIIMELTPGVGGQEAMLFTKDMFNMYSNFVQWKGWNLEVLKYDETGIGGLRSGHIAISGENACKILKYECGVHRVQRIPKTEKAGRIHTSTMTVAILPQPSDIDITINPKDIEMEFKRSSGAGGQHVNTTDSCVRLYHKPTGMIVESQMERDQHRNRQLAMMLLRAKLYEKELEKVMNTTSLNRKLQIGTAARSEKIRTYNFVQDRITDHRSCINLHNIESFFRGEELFNVLLEKLQEWNSLNILIEIIRKYESI